MSDYPRNHELKEETSVESLSPLKKDVKDITLEDLQALVDKKDQGRDVKEENAWAVMPAVQPDGRLMFGQWGFRLPNSQELVLLHATAEEQKHLESLLYPAPATKITLPGKVQTSIKERKTAIKASQKESVATREARLDREERERKWDRIDRQGSQSNTWEM